MPYKNKADKAARDARANASRSGRKKEDVEWTFKKPIDVNENPAWKTLKGFLVALVDELEFFPPSFDTKGFIHGLKVVLAQDRIFSSLVCWSSIKVLLERLLADTVACSWLSVPVIRSSLQQILRNQTEEGEEMTITVCPTLSSVQHVLEKFKNLDSVPRDVFLACCKQVCLL